MSPTRKTSPLLLSMPVLLGLAALGLTAPAAHAQFGSNLVVNGNAETGAGSTDGSVVPVPGWTTSGNFTVVQYGASGGFPAATDPGPANRGSNFFAGGPSNGFSSATQTINVSQEATAISAGTASYTLSGYLGGFASQDDNAVFSATFLGANGSILGTGQIGSVFAADRGDQTGLLFRSSGGAVPVGTQSIAVDLQMTREEGDYNDGYADNLSLVLDATPVPEASTTVSFGLLLMLGLGGLTVAAKRRKSAVISV